MYYAKETVNRLINSKKIVIYGARIVADEVANCLMDVPYSLNISAFIVSNLEGNPKELLGIPVLEINEAKVKYRNAAVVVAVLEKYLDEILTLLSAEGFDNIIPLTFESDLWSLIRGNYYIEMVNKQGKKYLTLEEELEHIGDVDTKEASSVSIYEAKCHLDKKLEMSTSTYKDIKQIQVGAALTDQVISDIRDDIGENISSKNRQYCELTALYWIWKNDNKSKYVGLCHYRRHFLLDTKQVAQISKSGVDVILTIPILNFPSVRSAYAHDHIIADWDIMLQGIEKLAPEYIKTAEKIQNGNYYYAYNMFIAKKGIFDAYCQWLFPILFYCEERCGYKENSYQNRYIGFLAERLLTIFFIHNEGKWKIVHAKKEFLMR